MRYYAIDFADEFKCIAGECPYTCCKGWTLAVDEETLEAYRKEPGIKGLVLKAYTLDGKIKGPCLYQRKNGLCSFQQAKRLDLMPRVCREYPRRMYEFREELDSTEGARLEMYMELSCYEAARIFVEGCVEASGEQLKFFGLEEKAAGFFKELKPNWTFGNADADYLDFLSTYKENLARAVMTPGPWRDKLKRLYRDVYANNLILGRGVIPGGSLGVAGEDDLRATPQISPVRGNMLFPVKFLNIILYGQISRSKSARKGTVIGQVINNYSKAIGGLTEGEADQYVANTLEVLLEENKWLEGLFAAYLAYLLEQSLCEAYEDYYLLKPFLLSVASAELLMLLTVTEYLSGNEPTVEAMIRLLCNLEKASRHRLAYGDAVMEMIRKDFFQ